MNRYIIKEKVNRRNSSTKLSYFFIPLLFHYSIFKKDKTEKSKRKGKGAQQISQQEAASELKSIIQEMIAEIESQGTGTSGSGAGYEDSRNYLEEMPGSFQGRSKDISEFETKIQARRSELDSRLRKIGAVEDTVPPAFDEPLHELPGAELEPFEKPDEIKKRVHYKQHQFPKHELDEVKEVTIRLPKQPKRKPTEESIVEFDESKYFHVREPVPDEKIVEYEDWDLDQKAKVKKSKEFRVKQKRTKKKKRKRGKIDIQEARKELAKKRKTLTRSYLDELHILDNLMDVLETVKGTPKKGGMDVDQVMKKVEDIVKNYQTTKSKKYSDSDTELEELEELEVLDELEELDDNEVLEKLEELEELEELDELEVIGEVDEVIEELEPIDDMDYHDHDDTSDIEVLEELEPIDPKPKKGNLNKKSKKSRKRSSKQKKKIEDEEIEELEELEEIE